MKKIIFSIISFLSIFGTTNTFFGDPSSLDLYKNLEKGIINLESNMLKYELNGGEKGKGILNGINKIIVLNEELGCLDESKTINKSKLENIIKEKKIGEIKDLILMECLKVINRDDFNKAKTKIIENYTKEKNKLWKKYKKDNSQNSVETYKKGKKDLEYKRDSDIINLEDNLTIVTTNTLNIYMKSFKEYYDTSNIEAVEKTKQIHTLSNIGLYSDGTIKNSGFDLITDLEEIDEIIFAKTSNFSGLPNEDLEKQLEKLFEPLQNTMEKIKEEGFLEDVILNEDQEKEIGNIEYSPPTTYKIINSEYQILGKNNYICSDNTNSSGLSESSISSLLSIIETKIDNNNTNINSNYEGNNTIEPTNEIINEEGNRNENDSNYEKIVDNKEWPCLDFFCITVDFVVNENSLFGSFEYITIEYLLNRSNSHLKKFASSSLIPAKMTTNNFELGLKDINLSDIFHIGFQISTKPVPILNIENKSKKDQGEYSSKNLLERYYKANGLDYKRRNDLNLLKSLDANKQVINNGNRLSTTTITTNFEDYKKQLNVKKEKNNLLNKAIEKKVSNGIMETFETQYIEISKFTVGINSYIKNLDSIISAMRKIPIDNG